MALCTDGSRFVVKRTFIEVVEEPSNFGLRERASSDFASYGASFEKPAESGTGGRDFDIELTGLSDVETNADLESDLEADLGGNPPCYRHMPEGLPLAVSGDSNSDVSDAACSTHAQDDSQKSDLQSLLSENARLAMENNLLRERARMPVANAPVQGLSSQAESSGHAAPECEPVAVVQPWGGFQACYVMPWHPTGFQASWPEQPWDSQRGDRRSRGKKPAANAHAPTSSPWEQVVEARTTVMLRNLPNNYTRAMVLAMLDREGFAGKYDFLYLPMDFKTRACLGYAFVNLVSESLVPRFWQTFDGYSKWVLPSKKQCGVTWSGPHQGLEAHVERYRNSPVMHPTVPEEFRPVVFQNGRRVPFPPPTKVPRLPRERTCKPSS